jgi:hypothetical protein
MFAEQFKEKKHMCSGIKGLDEIRKKHVLYEQREKVYNYVLSLKECFSNNTNGID